MASSYGHAHGHGLSIMAGWLNPIMVMVMVMVSINFASLNPGLTGRLLPTGLPHAHPRISNILGHGYKLMAISLGLCLWRFACALAFGDLLVPWPRPRPWRWPWPCPTHRQWPQAQSHGHGKDGHGIKPQAKSPSPKPWQSLQAMAQGDGHGSGLKLMAREM